MNDGTITVILEAIWTAFGASPAHAKDYAALNLKQIKLESGGCASASEGLFRIAPAAFNTWRVAGLENNRYNPVSNLAAAVNIQINSKFPPGYCATNRVLNGCGPWAAGAGGNPYAA
jgi:hypothetical protein